MRLAEPIKAPGEYEVRLELAPKLTTTITVEVIGEREVEAVVEQAADDGDEAFDHEGGEDVDQDEAEDEATA